MNVDMANNILVTIGLPTYNTPLEYFEIVINQIINQTYTNIDLLIVDDGSKKEFADYLQTLKDKDNRIRIIFKKQNTGIYDTRNLILNNIKGNLFTFIDSDDYVPLNYIEKLVKGYESVSTKNSIVCCTFIKFFKELPLIELNDKTKIITENILEKGLMGKFGHSACAKLIPTNVLESLVIRDSNGFDDAQLIPSLCEGASKVILIESTFYGYRQISGSIMHSNNFTLYQAYRTYERYLEIAKTKKLGCISYLEFFVCLQKFKLCCVSYNNDFKKSCIIFISKELRPLFRKCKKDLNNSIKKQGFLIIYFPKIYCILYTRKRRKTTEV